MTLTNPLDEAVARALQSCRTIAVVGLSNRESRASNDVARYMQAQGYRIVPVNPLLTQVLGQRCYAQLADIPFAVDMVNVFRRPEELPPIAEQAVQMGAKCLWQQLGIANEEAAQTALAAGLLSVMDRCLMIEHRRWASTLPRL